MTRTVLGKLTACTRFLTPFALLAVQSQFPTTARAQGQAPAQHFVCNIGYTPQKCAEDMAVLRRVLAKYPTNALGEWTWVLVRSEDWRRILLDRGFNPDTSPAFSILPNRETFFEGALLAKVSHRSVELSGLWHMRIEDLLDLAVRHELGHALCNETDEAKANRIARFLQGPKPVSCEVKPAAKVHSDEIVRVVPGAALAREVVVIGGTEPQGRFVSCVAEVSADELRKLPNSDQPMTFVILEHRKFLQTRDAFHAYRTTLAFSNLAIRRIYLSSRVFADRETALWVIGHELGHFVIRDGIEGHAEFAAERIRWRARQTCPSGLR
jgi:hypothetical protein